MHASIKTLILTSCLAVLAACGFAADADELPAVSGPNGKFSVEGGTFDDQGLALALGSFAVPLGHSFGLQADGAFGEIDSHPAGGGGLHLFARDPSHYLLGVYGSYHTWESVDVWRAAAEGEVYINRFSISGIAGYERTSTSPPPPVACPSSRPTTITSSARPISPTTSPTISGFPAAIAT
jgi:hypothetical protein